MAVVHGKRTVLTGICLRRTCFGQEISGEEIWRLQDKLAQLERSRHSVDASSAKAEALATVAQQRRNEVAGELATALALLDTKNAELQKLRARTEVQSKSHATEPQKETAGR